MIRVLLLACSSAATKSEATLFLHHFCLNVLKSHNDRPCWIYFCPWCWVLSTPWCLFINAKKCAELFFLHEGFPMLFFPWTVIIWTFTSWTVPLISDIVFPVLLWFIIVLCPLRDCAVLFDSLCTALELSFVVLEPLAVFLCLRLSDVCWLLTLLQVIWPRSFVWRIFVVDL